MDHFEKVKNFLTELECEIVSEDPEEQLVVVNKEEEGILNMVIDCEDPILIIEQFLFDVKTDNTETFKSLLQKNREIVHGAFTLDETGTRVIFRDTLQLENLDLNELEGSLNSLSLLISEYYEELLTFAKA
ncbi:YbjN domain-containing protein [Chondrinema litorale]|uniref:YbjN domain-containing protein n=1 Tax=Chondrinema litorale TaxID=2994555 RepID=UPI000C6A1068|nr:YbjN domain-containing protein [Chondrinema litorale]MBT30786.1 molecular chaperone Tir [Thalassovita sp.]UZR93966.1 YbjN domain-containing protein [Chondrinema litorale]|tara:strand:+ start:315 stop:707 length:393 start_codon:yes stop_codon:yes gene_type:complete